MGGNLALVQSFVLLAGVLYPQRPVAEVARMLDQEPVVATVRRQADRQQLVVFPPEPGHLQKWGEREREKKQCRIDGHTIKYWSCQASAVIGGRS